MLLVTFNSVNKYVVFTGKKNQKRETLMLNTLSNVSTIILSGNEIVSRLKEITLNMMNVKNRDILVMRSFIHLMFLVLHIVCRSDNIEIIYVSVE